MITELKNLPSNLVGFKAEGEITKDDFTNVVMPRVQELIDRIDKLNYLLVIDTDLSKFTLGSWVADAAIGVKHLLKWNRAAIVSDKEGVRIFTDLFSKVMVGEFKGFEKKDLQQAIDWASGSQSANA